MMNGGPWFIVQHVEEITCGKTATVTCSAQNVGPDHTTQRCAMCLQSRKKVTFVSIVVVKTTPQEDAPTGLMTTEKNQGQHLGTSRVKEQVTQVTIAVFTTRTRILITKQGLTRDTIGNTHLIIIIFNLHH